MNHLCDVGDVRGAKDPIPLRPSLYTLLLEDSCCEHELQDGVDGQFVDDL